MPVFGRPGVGGGGGGVPPLPTAPPPRPPTGGGYYGGGGAPQGGTGGGRWNVSGGGGSNYPVAPAMSLTTAPDPALSALTGYASTQMAQADPLLLEAMQNYRNRMSTDTTQRAIGRAGGAIDDSLAAALQRTKEEASVTGMSGGTEAQRGASLTDSAQRAKAGAAADITLGRERDLDMLAGGFAGAAGAGANNRLGWGNLNLGGASASAQNQIAGQQNQISMAQLLQQQQQAQQQAMMQAYNMAYA